MEQLKAMIFESTKDLTAYQMFMLGRVEAGRSAFKFAEREVKAAKKELDEVPKNSIGLKSVASFYENMQREAMTNLSSKVTTMRKAEKFYRKLKHEAMEAGISQEVLIDFVNNRNLDESK